MKTMKCPISLFEKAYPTLIILTASLVSFILGGLLEPRTFSKFFSILFLKVPIPPLPGDVQNVNFYWDIAHYAAMAIQNTCTAFYPLWPWLIRTSFHPQTTDDAAKGFMIYAMLFFVASIPLTFWLIKRICKVNSLAILLTIAYFINPNSIFRVIGYTESLFSLLLLVFICFFHCKPIKIKAFRLAGCLFILLLMSLTRPTLIQIIFSLLFSLTTVLIVDYFEKVKTFEKSNIFKHFLDKKHSLQIQLTFLGCIAASMGYSIYGYFCFLERNDFLAPFKDQRNWGRAFGIHPELLILPKSPLIDHIALYVPLGTLIFSGFLIYQNIFHRNKENLRVLLPNHRLWYLTILYPPIFVCLYIFDIIYFYLKKHFKVLGDFQFPLHSLQWAPSYTFWFCLYFTLAHVAIAFLTQDRLYSLSRFVFSTPLIFICLAFLLAEAPQKQLYPVLWGINLISMGLLVEQWTRYGKDLWLG
jgi:hypothetical protein